MKRTKWIGVVVLLVLVGAAAAWWLRRDAKSSGPATVQTTPAERRDLEVVAEASGLVEAIRVVEVKSKASGEVLRVHHESGDRVAQGTLLAEIDPRDVQSALEQAAAELESARVTAQVTEANRARMTELRQSNTVTQQEYESAIQSAATARAAVVRNETSLRLARERRNDVIIKAPITGTVLERSVEPGQIIASATSNVSGGTTLFEMADLAQIQVRAKVDESDIGRITVGQRVRVSVEAYPGRTFEGQVAKIEPQAVVEQNVTLFPVLVRLGNEEGLLRPGMNAEVQIEIARRAGVLAVPSTSIVSLRELAVTATALGLDPQQVQEKLRAGAAGDGAQVTTRAVAGGGATMTEADCAALREQIVAAGGRETATDEQRAKFRLCRELRAAKQAAPADAAAPGSASNTPVLREGSRNAASRRGIVFVQTATGLEPRGVTLGLSDWEYTELLAGVSEGEAIVQVGVVKAQRQQQQFVDQFRSRQSGPIPGAGGGRMGGGGGGGQRGGGAGR